MITRPTVLVLGAGASAPYGFPLGLGLIEKVCAHFGGTLEEVLQGANIELRRARQLQEDLRSAAVNSIDAFLDSRADEMTTVTGKALIAAAMIAHEGSTVAKDPEEDWYRYIWNLMKGTRAEHFRENRLSVITFNYDRSLEAFFKSALCSLYKLQDSDAQELMRSVPIVHVHGSLGALSDSRSPYNALLKPDREGVNRLRAAIDGIRVIHEEEHLGKGFESAHAFLEEARTVFFLGFGYHPENIRRLRLEKYLPPAAGVWGTTVGLKQREVDTFVLPLFPERPGKPTLLPRGSREMLREECDALYL